MPGSEREREVGRVAALLGFVGLLRALRVFFVLLEGVTYWPGALEIGFPVLCFATAWALRSGRAWGHLAFVGSVLLFAALELQSAGFLMLFMFFDSAGGVPRYSPAVANLILGGLASVALLIETLAGVVAWRWVSAGSKTVGS